MLTSNSVLLGAGLVAGPEIAGMVEEFKLQKIGNQKPMSDLDYHEQLPSYQETC